MDDDVQVAPIYRCGGMIEELRRPHMNHDLHIEWEAARLASHCKQPALAKGVHITGSLAPQQFDAMTYMLDEIVLARMMTALDLEFEKAMH